MAEGAAGLVVVSVTSTESPSVAPAGEVPGVVVLALRQSTSHLAAKRVRGGSMLEIVEALRSRKIVQWTLSYLVAAWITYEVLEGLGGPWGVDDRIMRLVQLLLAAGLPLVIILAHFHGERGRQTVGRLEVLLLTTVAVGGLGLVWAVDPLSTDGPARQVVTSSPRSITVVPFADLSQDEDRAYLAAGVAEEIMHLLAQVPELRVSSQSSAAVLQDRDDLTDSQIATRLGVEYVLTGSLQAEGDRVRVRVRLSPAEGGLRFSSNYEGTMADVFAMQDSVAADVVTDLVGEILGGPPTSARTNPQAYELFLRGRHVERQRSDDEWYSRSAGLLEQALAIEPDHVPSMVQLAVVHFEGLAFRDPPEGRRLARELIDRALALDSTNARAHSALSALLHPDDLHGMAREMERAYELAPRDPQIVLEVAITLSLLGRDREAIPFHEWVTRAEPLDPLARTNLAVAYYIVGRWEDALRQREIALELQPGQGQVGRGMALLQMERLDEAREAFEATEGPSQDLGLAVIAHREGRPGEAAERMARFEAASAARPAFVAMAYAMLEDREMTFRWLDTLTAGNASVSPALMPIASRPEFAWLEGDRRWEAFKVRVGQDEERFSEVRFDPSPPG